MPPSSNPPNQPYKRLYPDQELIVFDGGKDNKFEPSLIPDNESPDCLNVEFVNGAVTTRQGSIQLNTTPCGGSVASGGTVTSAGYAFDGLYSRRAQDGVSETMCAWLGGSFYTLATTTFITVPSAQSVFSPGHRIGAALAENYIFMCDGQESPYKWDGTYFTKHGVYPPANAPTVATGTTGSLATSGNYVYVYTLVNTHLVESNYSPPVSFTVGAASGYAAILSVPTASTASMGYFDRYIYRTLNINSGGVSGAFWYVGAIGNVSTTTFVDTVNDTKLGQPAPTDNGVPPNYNAIAYCQGMLFCNDVNNPSYVWFSDPGQGPFTFPSTNFFRVGDNTGDLVKGFAPYDNHIVIFCERSTVINYMGSPNTSISVDTSPSVSGSATVADPSNWRQIITNSPYGSKSPYCAIRCDVRGQDMLLHPAVQNEVFAGFGALSGQTIDPTITIQPMTSAGSLLQSQVIEPDMFLVPNAYLGNISGISYKNRAFISLPLGRSATYNNTIYVWDYSLSNVKKSQLASWVPWSGTGLNVAQFCIYGGKLYGASSLTDGYVYQLGDTGTYNDAGTAINSYFWTKEFPGFVEDTQLTKDFRYVNILVDLPGNFYMNLAYKTDSQFGAGLATQIDLSSGGSVWGSGAGGLIWGSGDWGTGNAQQDFRVYLGGLSGKRVQFQFSNQNVVNQSFKVHHMQFLYNIRGYR